MESKYIKHMMMRVPDLGIRYEINDQEKVVLVDLPEHFDSSLFIWFALALEQDRNIRVVEYQIGYARPIQDLTLKSYRLVVCLAGVRFNTTVAQKMSLQEDRIEEFTVCLLREGAPMWGNS